MTYENIKTIILTILVATSALLTWNLWTYQPNYETMEKTNTVQEVAIAAKKDVSKIVRPDTLLFHLGSNQHYGTVNPSEIEKTIKEISRWNFTDFENITAQVNGIPSFVHNEGKAVIVYPDSIPIELYKTVIKVDDKDLTNFQFDRIVIDVKEHHKEDGIVYFVSVDSQQVFRSHVPASFIQSFKNEFFKYSPEYKEYISYEASNSRTLFLPAHDTKMARYQYLSKELDSEKYKNALFSDPSVVQKNYQPSEEEYNDNVSLLRVNFDKNTLRYVKLAAGNNPTIQSTDLLKKSIDFINEHAGWTDNYLFAEMNELNHRVTFRLYDSSGYPVFSEDPKISEIRQVWGQNEEYLRSNFQLGLRTESTEVSLSSGDSIIKYLKKLEGFDSKSLEDVALGYKMIKDSQTMFVRLEPSWFYRYEGEWKSISLDETGGMNNGLE
ncbi:regulatory protein YycH of two-component signal transduction system YycFG [Cytobacillus oceanisediminis]|uniref:Regulatory protein YycH of two-component signal transduction system YycFG n=1 Tax=Cytobacillus oceanisediminis TaxID=665099 RepID=A0A2V3A5A0_9BACI|nr:two-component system activity regulator YycH [Cytobacillus oceanisediminis]PWW31050.1 regulatory protein YycH of two-component signal transduction system YycFG [Cytobacillus oceanisediminis]